MILDVEFSEKAVELQVDFGEVAKVGGNSLKIVTAAEPGQMIRVKKVDAVGNPTEWETIDLLRDGETLFPETYISEYSVGGFYDPMEAGIFFNLPVTLEVGKTYIVTINGKEYTATASWHEGESEAWSYVELRDGYNFGIFYNPIGIFASEYSTMFFYNEEGNSEEEWTPCTLGILNPSDTKLSSTYLDMVAIKATLPTVDMIATFEDGTTATYKLFGEAVAK